MNEQLVIANVYGIVLSVHASTPSLLLQKRWKPDSDPVNSGRWELPGGKWRAWEPAQDCVRREVAEESGIRVEQFRRVVVTTDHNGQRVQLVEPAALVQMVDGPYPSVIVVLEATGSGEPSQRGDGSRDARWLPLPELERLLRTERETFTPLSLAAIEAWLNTTPPWTAA